MADPTREEFNAASQKVMQSAPAGLSREDFYALIDKELGLSSYRPDPTMLAAATRAIARQSGGIGLGMPAPTDELGNQVQTPNRFVRGIVENPALQSLAHPTSVGDIAGLMLPSSEMVGQKVLSAVARPALRVMTGAAGAGAGVATAPNGSKTNKFIRGVIGGVIGAGAPDAASMLSHIPGVSRVAEPLTSAFERLTNLHNPLTVAGREGRALDASRSFNRLPLWKQTEQFPEVPQPITGRLQMPPYQAPVNQAIPVAQHTGAPPLAINQPPRAYGFTPAPPSAVERAAIEAAGRGGAHAVGVPTGAPPLANPRLTIPAGEGVSASSVGTLPQAEWGQLPGSTSGYGLRRLQGQPEMVPLQKWTGTAQRGGGSSTHQILAIDPATGLGIIDPRDIPGDLLATLAPELRAEIMRRLSGQ